jgi:malate dehydrogenase (oxaloacetate-decarboxylating)
MITPTTSQELRGRPLLADFRHNHGTAFSTDERSALGLIGLLPPAVVTLEQQSRRVYEQYRAQPSDLAKNTYLAALHDRNEVLYYKLLEDHLVEMLPVVYDPTIAQAIEQFSHEFRHPTGVYLSIDHVDDVELAFHNYGMGADDVDLIVATDAEEILGIGDWGANGMDISIGKLAVYTAAAGVDPNRVIPVMLDVGTDRESLLNDPLYVGNRHSRERGKRYDDLVRAYVGAAGRLFPKALLHFEDFGATNARRILTTYQDRGPVFNDDIEGTGAIVLAAVLAGMRVAQSRARDQRIVIFGAGTAGVGIADQICDLMIRDGLERDDAQERIWLIDLPGLLTSDMGNGLRDYQRPYARNSKDTKGWLRHPCQVSFDAESRWPDMANLAAARETGVNLATVVGQVQPTILVGTSTSAGAFTEEIVKAMANHVDRPMIFPVSNPTEHIEALPADMIRWTAGRALIATGLPWEPIEHRGTRYHIGQANNALIYPGIGLGAIVSRARRVTAGMLFAASEAVAAQADVSPAGAGLLPEVKNLRASSAAVAVAVAKQAIAEGVARANLRDPVQSVQNAMWHAAYRTEDGL